MPARCPAASLPASRLPLGTPHVAIKSSPTGLHHVAPHPSSELQQATFNSTHDESDPASLATIPKDDVALQPDVDMASSDERDSDQPLTLAAARLQRQNKRIEVANAAMTAQPPTEKQRQVSKSKGKVWKPFDFITEMQSANQNPDATPSIVESRVNIFRNPLQTGPLSRSVSRLSQQTFDSAQSDAERRDSSFLESDDFQVFTGRKGRKSGGPGSYEDRTEPQIATVEATFNKREVSDIFGNELPGPSFMDGNPGGLDGQLQFIQHPNGDISAHLWSASRYEWENLGQYSNIRKKVEGQLAADRLKGETAWQALQQNTLAYFRTIAKQREAGVMGFPFGAKEIAAALPDQRPSNPASTVLKKPTSTVEMPAYPSKQLPNDVAPPTHWPNQERLTEAQPRLELGQLNRIEQHSASMNFRLNPALNFTPSPRDGPREDPFSSNGSYNNIYDQTTFRPQAFSSSPHNMASHQLAITGQVNHGHVNGFLAPGYMARGAEVQGSFFGQSTPAHIGSHQTTTQSQSTYGHPGQYTSQNAAARNGTSRIIPVMTPGNLSVSSVQPKPATPLESRTAMRNSVMSLREQAQERTRSQANIRTVLYDPYSGSPESTKNISEPAKPRVAPALDQRANVDGFMHLPGLGLPLQQQRALTTTLAPPVSLPYEDSCSMSENNLRDSSPDREWQRKPAESYDVTITNSHQVGNSPLVKKWDPSKVNEWWWSGTKFSRQEEFYQNVKATDSSLGGRFGTTIAPQLKPIGPRGSKATIDSPELAYNEVATRLLIPVLENLASYVQGPREKRRDYFSQWVKAPDWAIDRGPNGNDSFFDSDWGQPPARVGRDPRYRPLPAEMRFGNFDSGAVGASSGLDRRFAFGGRH